jgi:hypothetical protein
VGAKGKHWWISPPQLAEPRDDGVNASNAAPPLSLAGTLAMISEFFARLLPLIYAACFLGLLWQAFRIMGRGFAAVPRPGDQNRVPRGDRTGRLTIHPELLDADGQLTRDDLLTVRFGGDQEQPASPNDPS